MSGELSLKIKCPTCGQPTEYSPANPYRPFCSERCQTLDLGAWADERYKVPVPEGETVSVNEISADEGPSAESLPPKHHLN